VQVKGGHRKVGPRTAQNLRFNITRIAQKPHRPATHRGVHMVGILLINRGPSAPKKKNRNKRGLTRETIIKIGPENRKSRIFVKTVFNDSEKSPPRKGSRP